MPPSPAHRRFAGLGLRSLVLILVLAAGLSGWLERGMQTGPIARVDDTARAYLLASEEKTVEAFTVARLLNAGISLFRSVEVKPMGVGVSPFQTLEPVYELSEDFADIMLAASIAVFAQKIALAVGEAAGLTLILPAGCALLLLAAWLPAGLTQTRFRLSRLGWQVVTLALFIRLLVPVTGWVGGEITRNFMAADLIQAVNAMKVVGGDLNSEAAASGIPKATDATPPSSAPGAITSPPPGAIADPTLWDRMLGRLDRLQESVSSRIPNLDHIQAGLAELPRHIITAIEIFVVETMLIPLVSAVLLYLVIRQAVLGDRAALELARLTGALRGGRERREAG